MDFKHDLKSENKILLLEGSDDCHVVMHLCVAHKVPKEFCIYNCEGHEEALSKLDELLRYSRDERPNVIGIVLDTDKPEDNPSVTSRMDAVIDRLQKVCPDYEKHEDPDRQGTIIPNIKGFPKIGIWLMPNNQDIGMLEDFLLNLAKAKAKTKTCDYEGSLNYAEECVDTAKSRNFTSFKETYRAKATIHTYLAWHKNPGTPFGTAIKAGTLATNNEPARQFTNWLTRLFGE